METKAVKRTLPIKNLDEYFEYLSKEKDKQNTFMTKIKDFVKYRIIERIKVWQHDAKYYVRNRVKFNQVLKTWRPYDYRYAVNLFIFGLKELSDDIEHGFEEHDSRMKKVAAIHELIAELQRDYEEEVYVNYFPKSKATQVTEYEDGSVMFQYPEMTEEEKRAHEEFAAQLRKARREHFERIFRIIEGQDETETAKEVEKLKSKLTPEEYTESEKSKFYKQRIEVFDGTGIEGWWN